MGWVDLLLLRAEVLVVRNRRVPVLADWSFCPAWCGVTVHAGA